MEDWPDDPEYEAWVRQKIEVARASIRAGRVLSSEEVEAEFAALREETMRQLDDSAS